jgi:hypothetical protein
MNGFLLLDTLRVDRQIRRIDHRRRKPSLSLLFTCILLTNQKVILAQVSLWLKLSGPLTSPTMKPSATLGRYFINIVKHMKYIV